MPRPRLPDSARVPIGLKVSEDTARRIEAARGDVPAAAWVRAIVEEALRGHVHQCACGARWQDGEPVQQPPDPATRPQRAAARRSSERPAAPQPGPVPAPQPPRPAGAALEPRSAPCAGTGPGGPHRFNEHAYCTACQTLAAEMED